MVPCLQVARETLCVYQRLSTKPRGKDSRNSTYLVPKTVLEGQQFAEFVASHSTAETGDYFLSHSSPSHSYIFLKHPNIPLFSKLDSIVTSSFQPFPIGTERLHLLSWSHSALAGWLPLDNMFQKIRCSKAWGWRFLSQHRTRTSPFIFNNLPGHGWHSAPGRQCLRCLSGR